MISPPGASAEKSRVLKPGSTSASAPKVSVKAGNLVTADVQGLPKNMYLSVTILIGTKTVMLGTIKSSATGVAIIPAISASTPGSYLITMATSQSKKYYLAYVVKAG